MPSTLFYYRYPKPIIEKYARIFPKALPRIKTPVSPEPIKVKHEFVKRGEEGKLLVAGKYLTNLFREERIELRSHHARHVRPYAERLIQLAIEYGDCHKPTMEVCNYFLHEKDLIHKLFKVFVPRYRNCATAYTSVYQLPTFHGLNPERPGDDRAYVVYYPVVLELKGNPYPPVISKPEVHRNSLLNVLLDSARKQLILEKRKKAEQQPPASEEAEAIPEQVETSTLIEDSSQVTTKVETPQLP